MDNIANLAQVPVWVLLIIAIAPLLNTLLAAITLAYARRTEINTNSLSMALVEKTGKAEFHRGREEMREESDKTAAVLAKGALAGAADKSSVEQLNVEKIHTQEIKVEKKP